MKFKLLTFAAVAALNFAVSAQAAPVVGGNACITNNPYDGNPIVDGFKFESIPFGCDLTNGHIPIVFEMVPDRSGAIHTVTLLDLVLLTTVNFSDHWFVNATITPGSSFKTLGDVIGPVFATKPSLASQVLGSPISGTFTGGVLQLFPSNSDVLLRAGDPSTVNTYTQLVTDLGGGLFESSLTFDTTLDFTLDGGAHWVPNDPAFGLEAFNTANYPGLAPLVGVPEPLTFSIFGAGLAGVAVLRRRKRKAQNSRGEQVGCEVPEEMTT